LLFISINDHLDFSTPTGRLHFQILAIFSEFERSLISERTRLALQRKKQEGKRLGRPAGSKDKKQRKKSGYILRHARERQQKDAHNGVHRTIEDYIDK